MIITMTLTIIITMTITMAITTTIDMAITMTIGYIRLARDGARVISDETGAGIDMMRKVVFVRNSRTGKLIPLHLLLVKNGLGL